MRKIANVLLLLLLTMPSATSAGEPPSYEITWFQPPEAKSTELTMANLAFELNPAVGVCFPPQDLSTYVVFPRCGVGLVRLNVSWDAREPMPGVFDWEGLDNRVRMLQGLGIDVFMTLETDAQWGVERSSDPAANRPPAQMSDWTDFVAHLVERYDGDGVDDMPGLRRRVPYYQFVNEWPSPTNRSGGWAGTIDELITFLNASYDEVKATDPGATVVLGGIPAIGLDAMVLNAGLADYTARLSYSETASETLTPETAQDPEIATKVANRIRVLNESRYDMVDLHLYGPVEFNQYRVERVRQIVGDDVPLISAECGGPNLAYVPDITPEEHFRTVLDLNLDAYSRNLAFTMWLSMFGRNYDPEGDITWGNSRLQLIDADRRPTGGYWGYQLLAAMVDGMTRVEKASAGVYIIHRGDRPDLLTAWRTEGNDTYRIPDTIDAQQMLVVTNAQFGYYEVTTPPQDRILQLGDLPVVVGEELPGGPYAAGENPRLVPLQFP